MSVQHPILASASRRYAAKCAGIGCVLFLTSAGVLSAEAKTCAPSSASTFYTKWQMEDAEYDRFSQQPVEQQWAILKYAMDCVHPPRLEYHYFMARGGPRIANFLIRVLTATADESDVLDGISVFVAMKSLNIYDVSKDGQKMRVLTSSAEKVESEVFKQIVQRKLDQIGSGPD